MEYGELLQRARALDGAVLRTVTGKEFKVGVYRDCPYFTPLATGLGRSDGRKAAERFIERYDQTRSLRISDYADLTRNASYLLALVQ